MSHEYVKCKHCNKPVMEHLAAHTEIGSLCESCYSKSGLKEKHDKELEESMRTCTECGRKFLKRNFKTSYPDTTCGICGEAELKGKEVLSRDIPFNSDENQARDIVLGFICREGKRVGLRILKRGTGQVVQVKIPDELNTWNLNINEGNLYAKCSKLSDFPQLTLPEGHTGGSPFDPSIKLVTKQSGAWVLEELPDKVFRLVSVSGQIKDVAEQTALNFHNAYKIANAEVVDGRLSGTFRKPVQLTEEQIYITIDTEELLKLGFKEQPDKESLTDRLHTMLSGGAEQSSTLDSQPSLEELQVLITLDPEELKTLGFKEQPNKEEITNAMHEYIGELKSPKVLSEAPKISDEDLAHMKLLNEELKAACKAYYDDNDSPLSDLEYDTKFDQLLDLEHKTGYVLPDSVTQGVGAPVSGKLPKVQHKDRILSLDKTKDVPALQGLLNQDPDGEMGVLSWKMDGLTIVATYIDGKLKQAVTRGDGRIGEDVTHNAKFFKNMPRRIPYTGEIRVRGEAVIAYSTFERINANLPEGQEPYKNPRNLASGTVRRSEVTRDGSVEFVPFGIVIEDPKFQPKSYMQGLRFLEGQGFKPVEYVLVTADSMDKAVEVFKQKIANFDYPTDGLVLAIDDVFVYEKLGTTGRHPKGSIAFKWADEKQKTHLRSIEWSASRTGVLTPVAIFDPVDLEGTTVRRASVHNLTMLRNLKLGLGDEISIYKANMIIPQIAENHTQSDTVKAPATCPVCETATTIRKDGSAEFVMCPNPDCAAKNVGLLAHFAKREAMAIDGVSEKSIETLVSAGFISKPKDFYNLKNHPEIQELPGWGKSSYNKLLYAVEASRTPRLANFIYALGIRNVGRSASDALANHFGSIDAFLGATEAEVSAVEGIGAGMTADIMDFKTKNGASIKELTTMVSIVNPNEEVAAVPDVPAGIPKGAPNCLEGLTFCVTGKIDFPGARTALGEYIKSLGGKMASSVTKNTNYLITNTPNSGSSKNQAAIKLGCKVIPESAFYLLVEELSAKQSAPESASAPVNMEGYPDIQELAKEFNRVYDVLYNNRDNVTGYKEALTEGDKFISDNPDFVGAFARHRGDILSSDREVAALMIAIKNLGKTQGEQVVQAGVDSVVIPEDPREARIQSAEAIQALSGVPLAGLTFCVTGKVEYGTRAAFFNLIESNGGRTASSVTHGVDYLITNTPHSGTVKNRRAREVGAKVISEAEFFRLLHR